MFTDSDSFYYSETFDLTTSLQRQHSEGYQSNKHLPLWQQVDPRFFWNRHMLDELIQADRDPEASTMCRHDYFSLVPTKKCTSYIFKENLKWPCSNHCTSISHPKELDLLLIFPQNNRNCIQIFFINYHIKDVHFIIFLEHACTCISKLKYWIPCINLADTMFLFSYLYSNYR